MLRRLFARSRLLAREARFIRASLLLAGGINLVNWAVALWFVLPRLSTSPFFALHYTVYFGVDHIGEPWRIGATPLLGTALLTLNGILAVREGETDGLVGAFLSAVTVVLELLLLWATMLTVLINV